MSWKMCANMQNKKTPNPKTGSLAKALLLAPPMKNAHKPRASNLQPFVSYRDEYPSGPAGNMNIEVKTCPQWLINFATLCHHRGCLGQAGLSRLCPTPGNKAPWLGPPSPPPLLVSFFMWLNIRKLKKNNNNKYCHDIVESWLEEEERCPGWSMRLRLLGLLQWRCLPLRLLLPLRFSIPDTSTKTTSDCDFHNKSLQSPKALHSRHSWKCWAGFRSLYYF